MLLSSKLPAIPVSASFLILLSVFEFLLSLVQILPFLASIVPLVAVVPPPSSLSPPALCAPSLHVPKNNGEGKKNNMIFNEMHTNERKQEYFLFNWWWGEYICDNILPVVSSMLKCLPIKNEDNSNDNSSQEFKPEVLLYSKIKIVVKLSKFFSCLFCLFFKP